jgi:hypothetical protein
MSYIPAYNALFAKPLLNQCIAIIQRDQASAIAIVNQSLAPIREFHKGPGLRTAFPWLTVALDGEAFERGAQTFTRQQTARVGLMLDVGQFDQEWAEDNAQDYARMLDMVITSADLPPQNPGPGSSWETSLPITQETVPSGTTTPNASGTVKEVFVESHRYGLVTLDEIQTPVLRVTLNVEFMLEET